MILFDSHLHLTSEDFSDEDILSAVHRAVAGGITSVMDVATDRRSLQRSHLFASQSIQYGMNWYQAAATPPQDVHDEERELFFTEIEALAIQTNSLQAIGETGLDYYYGEESKSEQQELFNRYIELSKKSDLPLIIHCRAAFQDFFSIIRSHGETKGVLHCFTGTKEDAKQLIDLGWYISLSGIVTYKKSAQELQEIAAFIPDNHLIIETDAPYLSPVPKRWTRNEPLFLFHTLSCIAALRGISTESLGAILYQNTQKLFGKKVL